MIHSDRYRGRVRSRILYWFRTPPGVKVGRSALDEIAIRSIEERHPDIEFDWTRILKEQAPPEAPPRPPFPERRGPRRPSEARVARPAPAEAPFRPAPERHRPPPPPEPPSAEPERLVEPPSLPAAERDAETYALPDTPSGAATPTEEAAPTLAHARLGAEGVLRLRARHAEIRARISERVSEPNRQDELKTQAERLNPDTWVTEEEVRLGLEQYESVLDALRTVVGQGRRRRRRPGAPRDGSTEPDAAPEASNHDPGPAASAGGRHAEDEEPV